MTEPKVDLSKDSLVLVCWGLIYQVVCAPKSWQPEKVAEVHTRLDPPGTSAGCWVISELREREDQFNNTNNIPCQDCPDRIHWLVNC